MTSNYTMDISGSRLLGNGMGLDRIGRGLRSLDRSREGGEVGMGHRLASSQSLRMVVTEEIVEEVESLGSHQMLHGAMSRERLPLHLPDSPNERISPISYESVCPGCH